MKNKLSNSRGSFFTSLDGVTKTLLSINVLAYILTIIEYPASIFKGLNIEQLLNIGAVTESSALTTIFISLFLHYNLMHFIINMAVLALLSHTVSDNFSPMSYLSVYLLSGVAGNIITILFAPNVVAVGASGCIFGLVGMLLICSLQKNKFPKLNDLFMWIFITALVFFIATFFSNMTNGISHITGMVTGGIIGYAISIFKIEVFREG